MKWIEGSTKLTKGQHEVTERLTQGRDHQDGEADYMANRRP